MNFQVNYYLNKKEKKDNKETEKHFNKIKHKKSMNNLSNHRKGGNNANINEISDIDIDSFIKINNDLIKLKDKIQKGKIHHSKKNSNQSNLQNKKQKNYFLQNKKRANNSSLNATSPLNNTMEQNNLKDNNYKYVCHTNHTNKNISSVNCEQNMDENNKFFEVKKKLEVLNSIIGKKNNNCIKINSYVNNNEKLNYNDYILKKHKEKEKERENNNLTTNLTYNNLDHYENISCLSSKNEYSNRSKNIFDDKKDINNRIVLREKIFKDLIEKNIQNNYNTINIINYNNKLKENINKINNNTNNNTNKNTNNNNDSNINSLNNLNNSNKKNLNQNNNINNNLINNNINKEPINLLSNEEFSNQNNINQNYLTKRAKSYYSFKIDSPKSNEVLKTDYNTLKMRYGHNLSDLCLKSEKLLNNNSNNLYINNDNNLYNNDYNKNIKLYKFSNNFEYKKLYNTNNNKNYNRYSSSNNITNNNIISYLNKRKFSNLQKTSFDLFVYQNENKNDNNYLNIINGLKFKIQLLETEIKITKEKLEKLMNNNKTFKFLSIYYSDSFDFQNKDTINKSNISKKSNEKNNNIERVKTLGNKITISEPKSLEKNEIIIKIPKKSFFHKTNLFKQYFKTEEDQSQHQNEMNLSTKNNIRVHTSHSVVYRKKFTTTTLTNRSISKKIIYDNYDSNSITTLNNNNNTLNLNNMYSYNNLNNLNSINNYRYNLNYNYNKNPSIKNSIEVIDIYYNNVNTIKNNDNIYNYEMIYTLYPFSNKNILHFSLKTKQFYLKEFIDTCSFKKNIVAQNESNGNIFLNYQGNFYIITGQNYDSFYIYNPNNKTMKKLSNLNYNHSNGNLISVNKRIFCMSGDYTKYVEEYMEMNDNWSVISQLHQERSNFNSCTINNKFIFIFLGYNSLSKQYLDTIEYIDITNENSKWEYLNYKNNSNTSLCLTNFAMIPINDNKIIIFGGYNYFQKQINEYYQINLELNLDNNIYNKISTIEKLNGAQFTEKYNNSYIFNCNFNRYKDENNNNYYAGFDKDLNVHIFNENNYQHEIFNFK